MKSTFVIEPPNEELASDMSAFDKSRSCLALLQFEPPEGLRKPILLPSYGFIECEPKFLGPLILTPAFQAPVPFSKLRESEKIDSVTIFKLQ